MHLGSHIVISREHGRCREHSCFHLHTTPGEQVVKEGRWLPVFERDSIEIGCRFKAVCNRLRIGVLLPQQSSCGTR